MAKTVKRTRVPKTRNGNTMTEAQFFQWLRQILRRSSMYWKPIAQVRKEAQVPYKGPLKRRRFSYVCSRCHKEFAAKDVNVHHRVDCGSLKSFHDLPVFAERLFCEKDQLILLCNKCHDKEHAL